ncbi:MAG: hypothetical protein J4473_03975 [Candidatus Aenigmarchaeota archaeon]|nr:hypothetical protein [Candidatus Aenigmarchaeota archaeon]
MAVDYERSLKRAWNYTNDPKRFGFFLLLIILTGLLFFAPYFGGMYRYYSGNVNIAANAISMILLILAQALVSGLIIHNFRFPKSLDRNITEIKKYYLNLVLSVIIIAGLSLLSLMLFAIPVFGLFVGIALIFLISLIFFFIKQDIVLKKFNVEKAMAEGWKRFNKDFLTIFVSFILVVVITVVIVLVSAIPMILLIASMITVVPTAAFAVLVLTSIISLTLGVTLAALLGSALITDIYLQLKK